jgi:hypothetical protein
MVTAGITPRDPRGTAGSQSQNEPPTRAEKELAFGLAETKLKR